MCKIILKVGSNLSDKEMRSHKEECEEGTGISGFDEKGFFSFKGLEYKEGYEKYSKSDRKSPFWLFHSRMTSAGNVVAKNIQPFHDKNIMLAHNGTVQKLGLMFSLAPFGEFMNGTESDSYLLFRVLRRSHFQTAKVLLMDIDDNFVLASRPLNQIWVIGRFAVETYKEKLCRARNIFEATKKIVCIDFNGKILYRHEEKLYNFQNYRNYNREWDYKDRRWVNKSEKHLVTYAYGLPVEGAESNGVEDNNAGDDEVDSVNKDIALNAKEAH